MEIELTINPVEGIFTYFVKVENVMEILTNCKELGIPAWVML